MSAPSDSVGPKRSSSNFSSAPCVLLPQQRSLAARLWSLLAALVSWVFATVPKIHRFERGTRSKHAVPVAVVQVCETGSASTCDSNRSGCSTSDIRTEQAALLLVSCCKSMSNLHSAKVKGDKTYIYRSPHKTTRISMKVEGFSPEDVSPGFSQRLQSTMAHHSKHVISSVMWAGCIALVVELHDAGLLNFDSDEEEGDMDAVTMAAANQQGDEHVLEALLASLQVPFAPGQRVMAEVEGRLYQIIRNAADAEGGAAWSYQLQPSVEELMLLPAHPDQLELSSLRLDYATPMCVLLSSFAVGPLHVRVTGRNLAPEASMQFAAQVQGRHLPCTHTLSDGGGSGGSSSSFGSTSSSSVQLLISGLDAGIKAGLLMLECRTASPVDPSVTVVVGVVPLLLLDSAWMSIELGELQHEVQRCASANDVASMAALSSLVVDLGHWLEWVDKQTTPTVSAEMAKGSVCDAFQEIDCTRDLADPMADVGRALLSTAIERGWEHTAVRVASGLTRLDMMLQQQAPAATAAGVAQAMLAKPAVQPPLLASRSVDPPLSQASSPVPSSANAVAVGVNAITAYTPVSAMPSTAAAALVTEAAPAAPQQSSLLYAVVRSMLFGFEAPGDEARYVAHLSDASSAMARSWLLLALVFVVLLIARIAEHRLWGNLIHAFTWGAPIYVTAYFFFYKPQQYKAQRETLWCCCAAGRVCARLGIVAGVPVLHFLKDFCESYGDILSENALPQAAEWVRIRYSLWWLLLDMFATAAQYRHLGMYDRNIAACLFHSLAKASFGIAINAAIELWSRHAFLAAVRRKRQ